MQFRIGLAALALAAVVASSASAQMKQQDVVLSEGGVLRGQMMDANSKPVANEEIRFYDAAGKVTKVVTNDRGAFQATGLSGGSLVAQSKHSVTYLRGWPQGTQPRHAASELKVNASPEAGVGVAQATYFGPNSQGPIISRPSNGFGGGAAGGAAGGGIFSNVSAGGVLVGGTIVGLATWGIVEVATDDDSAS